MGDLELNPMLPPTATPRGCSEIYPLAFADEKITQLAAFLHALSEPGKAERDAIASISAEGKL